VGSRQEAAEGAWDPRGEGDFPAGLTEWCGWGVQRAGGVLTCVPLVRSSSSLGPVLS
jgi:hypothetical protein